MTESRHQLAASPKDWTTTSLQTSISDETLAMVDGLAFNVRAKMRNSRFCRPAPSLRRFWSAQRKQTVRIPKETYLVPSYHYPVRVMMHRGVLVCVDCNFLFVQFAHGGPYRILFKCLRP